MVIFRTNKRPAPWVAANYFRRSYRLHLSFRSRLRSKKERTVAYDAQKKFSGLRSATNANSPALLRRKRGVSCPSRKEYWNFGFLEFCFSFPCWEPLIRYLYTLYCLHYGSFSFPPRFVFGDVALGRRPSGEHERCRE